MGSTYEAVTAEDVGALRIEAHSLNVQREIARFLDEEAARVDALIEKRRQAVRLFEERFFSLCDSLTGPQERQTARLRHACGGVTVGVVVNPSTYVDERGTVPFFRGMDVRRFHVDVAGAERISEDSNRLLVKSMLRAGDIVSVRVGEPGVSAVVPPEADGSNCASLLITRRREGLDSRYLCYVFNSVYGQGQFQALANGAAQLQVNVSDAVDLRVPLPPLDEQQRIADELDGFRTSVERFRAVTDRQIAMLQERRRAVIAAAVTGQLDIWAAA